MTSKPSRKSNSVIPALETVLSDIYLMTVKTHGFHWNIESPNFIALHTMLETQYNALFQAADVVAERIRALDSTAPGSFAEFTRHANIKESTKPPSADAMLKQLLDDYDILGEDMEKGIEIAEEADDPASADALTGLLRDFQKTAWMIRAHIK